MSLVGENGPETVTFDSPAVVRPPRRFALVVTSHRGDLYLPGAMETWQANLPWDQIDKVVLHHDGMDGLAALIGHLTDLVHGGRLIPLVTKYRAGLSAAVAKAWAAVPEDITHVFHLEEDFHLCEPVDLDAMADVVDRDRLANMVLLRQPWTPEEQAAGGYQQNPAYIQQPEYLHHREGFWLNPCLIPADVIRGGGGNEPQLTARWRHRGFGVWGQRDDHPRCLHVGTEGGMGTAGWAA